MSFEVTTGATGPAVMARFENASDVIYRNVLQTMRGIGQRLTAGVMQKLRGDVLGYRTGNLGRSIGYVVEANETDRSITTRVTQDSSKAIYGRIQDKGGEIRPVNGSMLTIPLEAAKTGNGVARFTAKQVRDNPADFGYKSTFVAKGVIFGVKPGKAIKGQRGVNYVPLFALKPMVRLPARPYMQPTLDEQLDQIRREIAGAVRIGSQSDTSGRAL
jgi:hypothetical protein